MHTTSIGGHKYQIGDMSAMAQLHLARKLTPIIPAVLPVIGVLQRLVTPARPGAEAETEVETEADKVTRGREFLARVAGELGGAGDAIAPLTNLLAGMADTDFERLVQDCLCVVTTEQAGRWYPVQGAVPARPLMYQHIGPVEILQLCREVIVANLGPFIAGLLPPSPAPVAPDSPV